MLRHAFLALFAVLVWGPAATNPAFAQSNALPPISADGTIRPLTVDQLDPTERATFATLSPNSDGARQFLYTRGYLRYCRLVVAKKLAPLQLPPLPARSDWNRQFLSQDEIRDILDVALGMKLLERMNLPAR
jgi:hypothetical protein